MATQTEVTVPNGRGVSAPSSRVAISPKPRRVTDITIIAAQLGVSTAVLLENGDQLLLESGDVLLLEG